MDFIKQPMDIENKSMEIIAPHLAGLGLGEAETKVYSRMIHASGDVDYAQVIRLHPKAIEATQEALKRGANIYTDVEMVRTGINKKAFGRYGGKIECRVADPEIAEMAKREGITRSMAAMRTFGKALKGSIVAIGNAATRKRLMESLPDRNWATLIHPDAVIADDVMIGDGTAVMAGVVINPGTKIGRGCIVNTCSSVDHDCIIGDYVHISVGAHLSGTVTVGEGTWISVGASVSNNVNICGDCTIGAGAVVVKNLEEEGTYTGVPAKIMRANNIFLGV